MAHGPDKGPVRICPLVLWHQAAACMIISWLLLLRAQAWTNGLDHFLSSAPPDDVLEDVAQILSDANDGGAVVVRAMV